MKNPQLIFTLSHALGVKIEIKHGRDMKKKRTSRVKLRVKFELRQNPTTLSQKCVGDFFYEIFGDFGVIVKKCKSVNH